MNHHRKTSAFGLLLAIVGSSAGAMGQNLVANPGFESPPCGNVCQVNNGGNIAGWSVLAASVDMVGGSLWQHAQGAQSLDLNGSSGGGVSQALATNPGSRYAIVFQLAGNAYGVADKTLNLLWNGAVIQNVTFTQAGNTPTSMGWQTRVVRVVASGTSSQLAFQSTTGAMNGSQGFQPFYGPVIDLVSVTLTCVGDVSPSPSGDGSVNVADLLAVITSWGPCVDCQNCPADIAPTTPGCNVNVGDLLEVITHWGACP